MPASAVIAEAGYVCWCWLQAVDKPCTLVGAEQLKRTVSCRPSKHLKVVHVCPQVRIEISRKAEKRTTLVLWGGLAYMATQFGILARLTWWEYSWDIMEPVTYFITYGSAMAMYAYFVMTRQVRNRNGASKASLQFRASAVVGTEDGEGCVARPWLL